ncbi:MAG TPA: hypothetical protein VKA46_00555 [Gemmataceae bacterium]|nr:hypothetical protein [Gemmataceae bacterium]
MRLFIVGEGVVVRFGERRGQQGEVVEKQPADVHKVRLRDGTFLYFGSASLLGASSDRSIRQAAATSVMPSSK